MYRVLLERGAEKDLSRLSTGIHDRVIAALKKGMEAKSKEFVEKGAEVYAKA